MENVDRERSCIEVEVYCWMRKRCIWRSQQFFQYRREYVYDQSYVTPFRTETLWKLHDCSIKIYECAEIILIYSLQLC